MKACSLLIGLFLTVPGLLEAKSIEGTVFIDQNGNGVRDRQEKGLAGVSVSDQQQVVVTSSEGYYRIDPLRGFGIVFLSMPDGYTCKAWWRSVGDQSTEDFALIPQAVKRTFTFVHASDTHTSEKNLDRMQKLRNAIDLTKPDFVLVSGDLVRDALRVPETEARSCYENYRAEIAKINVPVWSVPGNHEIFGIERHLSLVSPQHPLYGKKMYRSFLGPNYYSFNFGGIHFIGLDDVDFEDTWYFGRVDSLQVEWLKNDLSRVPANTPVVTFKHMPFFSGGLSLSPFTETGPGRTLEREDGVLQFRHVVANAHELLKLLTSHPYPVSLAGHFHARQVYQYESAGQNVRFEQTGAVVGPSGEEDLVFPSGITVYRVTEGVISPGTFIKLDDK